MKWQGRSVLVTGGASFIGSQLVDALVQLGAKVRVVENLSSGKRENIGQHLKEGGVEFIESDLRDPAVARSVMR